MKTSALLAIVALGAVVAVSGLVMAAGPVSNALGTQGGDGHHHGMMGQSGGMSGCSDGQAQSRYGYQNQYQCDYQSRLSEPQQNASFQHCIEHEYDWSYGDTTACAGTCGCACQEYAWNYSHEEAGPWMA